MLTTNLSFVTNTVQSTLQQSANESRPFKSWNKTPVGQISFSIPARKATVFLNLPKNLKTGQTQVYISNPFFHTVKAGKLLTLAHQHWKITFGWAPSARLLDVLKRQKTCSSRHWGQLPTGAWWRATWRERLMSLALPGRNAHWPVWPFLGEWTSSAPSDTAGTWQMSISTQT